MWRLGQQQAVTATSTAKHALEVMRSSDWDAGCGPLLQEKGQWEVHGRQGQALPTPCGERRARDPQDRPNRGLTVHQASTEPTASLHTQEKWQNKKQEARSRVRATLMMYGLLHMQQGMEGRCKRPKTHPEAGRQQVQVSASPMPQRSQQP